MADPTTPAPGAFSRLLAELAAAPRRAQEAAWERGFKPGDLLADRFELGEPIGRGGFGVVFRAHDRKLNRAVACKLAPPGGQRDPTIQREADVVARLEHANLVRLYDCGACASGAFLVFELLRGETLAERLARGPVPRSAALRVAADVARGLAYAHRHGVVHRDLKPANVFLLEDGQARVLDFGLAYFFGEGPRRSGTPGYMAPEQIRGGPEDARTDVFALGVLLREMLAGREGRPLPDDLAAPIARACDPEPARRPSSVEALAAELERLEERREMEAHAAYSRGVACAERPVHGEDCGAHFRRALELDPGFALAAWRLAIWASWNGRPLGEVRARLREAEGVAARAPEKERLLIHAWAEHLDGREAEALALFEEAGRRWPDEKLAFYQPADILRHLGRNAEAVPLFEHALDLDPDDGWALGGLVQALGTLGRLDELRARATAWEATPGPGSLHALSLARGWQGDLEGALEAARRAERAGGGLPAREDFLGALVFAGRLAEARPELEGLAAPGSPDRRMGYYGLAALECLAGRPRAGLARLDELAHAAPDVEQDAVYHAVRADYLAGDGDVDAVRAEVEKAGRIDAAIAAEHAVTLAWLGDVEGAEARLRGLPPDVPLSRTAAALVRLRRGDAGGLDALRRAAEECPALAWRVAPLFLLGVELERAGEDEAAVATLRRAEALYLPLAMWRAWAVPRSRLLGTRALARLGRTGEARAALDRLLATAPDPEPGCSWAAEAAALRRALAAR